MADYFISHDKLMAELCDGCEFEGKCDPTQVTCCERELINSIPAADARPVVRGRWITRPYMMGKPHYCSHCGENYGVKYHYCPNCGADNEERG